jgi:hypothetical protein
MQVGDAGLAQIRPLGAVQIAQALCVVARLGQSAARTAHEQSRTSPWRPARKGRARAQHLHLAPRPRPEAKHGKPSPPQADCGPDLQPTCQGREPHLRHGHVTLGLRAATIDARWYKLPQAQSGVVS